MVVLTFLLPISIRSFVVKYKTPFLPEEKIEEQTNYIVYLTDKEIGVDLDDYIIGVVAGEMPALFEKEALKAQAVAARSYFLSRNNINITSTTNDQVFLTNEEMRARWKDDFDKYYQRIKEAVISTNNEVIKREGNILMTFYFSMSNGFTKDSKAVFNQDLFISTESKWDNENLRNFVYEKHVTESEIKKAFNVDKTPVINIKKRSKTNHVEEVIVNGKSYTGIQFRKKLGLRSADFHIKKENNGYIITTRGFGHGVGMSQHGANGMAKDGYNYIDILKHYYNDIEIINL